MNEGIDFTDAKIHIILYGTGKIEMEIDTQMKPVFWVNIFSLFFLYFSRPNITQMFNNKNMASEKINIFWFRRDLRLEDNRALHEVLHGGRPVLPVFIFDTEIIDELSENDARINFIYDTLSTII